MAFQKNFAWGTATAAYQIEGAHNEDGKRICAVTQALVNNLTMGYGIFIENMLDAAA